MLAFTEHFRSSVSDPKTKKNPKNKTPPPKKNPNPPPSRKKQLQNRLCEISKNLNFVGL